MNLVKVDQEYIFKSPILYDNLGNKVENSTTVQILILKESGDNEGYYWTGSGWSITETWLSATHLFKGKYKYSATLDSAGFIGTWWRDLSYPLFEGNEEFEVVGTRLDEETVLVDSTYISSVSRLRRYLRDLVAKNYLWEEREASDTELKELLEDALNEINESQEPLTSFSIASVPWFLLRDGAILQYLKSMGIHSARNLLSYSDPSGIQLKDHDTWGRYINYYNILVNKYRENLINIKRRINIANCYGDKHSEWYEFYG